MMALHAAQMLIGLALEAMLGWPMFLYTRIGHPVSWLGRLIALGDRHWNDETEDDDTRQSRGTMLALGIILLTGGVALALSCCWCGTGRARWSAAFWRGPCWRRARCMTMSPPWPNRWPKTMCRARARRSR
jgi:cobalamin biosynthesis protein CobD/CbiB